MKALLLTMGLISLAAISQADSVIRIVNNSASQVDVIWQAVGCTDAVTDPEGDDQFTVCDYREIDPGEEEEYSFDWYDSDRSVKVWSMDNERIGYCNSMDDETLTITGTTPENQKASGC